MRAVYRHLSQPLNIFASLLLALAVLLTAAGPSAAETSVHSTAAPTPRPLPITASGVLDTVRASGADLVLVNVWATWCRPCREEMPGLLELRKRFRDRGLRLVLVSADFPGNEGRVHDVLSSWGVDFQTFIKNQKDMEFINGIDPGWSGTLPGSFLFDGTGRLLEMWDGPETLDNFIKAIVPRLAARTHSR